MVATPEQPPRRQFSESGFTIIEFMIATAIIAGVLGGTVMLAMQMQQAYSTQLDDVAVEQEARYALDWIARDLRSAASDPYNVIPDSQEVWIDPNAGADTNDSIRVQGDVNPPDGALNAAGENVTIALNVANNVITRTDTFAADSSALAMTDAIITDLSFTHLNAARAATANPELVAYVQIQVTARSRGRNAYTRQFTTSTLATEVRLRTR